jgi:hypothetical protein
MLRFYSRKPPGRPKLNKRDPNITHMRVTRDLKDLLESEIQGRETLAECCLRLLRYRGRRLGEREQDVARLEKKVAALTQELLTKREENLQKPYEYIQTTRIRAESYD